MKNEMCEYSENNGRDINDDFCWQKTHDYNRENLPSKRVTCPKCGRRLMSKVGTCDDGCCVWHNIPPHKVKGWWKKNKKKRIAKDKKPGQRGK